MLYDAGEEWVPALSCFGGFAMYARAAVRDCSGAYSGFDEKHRYDCEHVAFSKCLIRHNHSLWMNPTAYIRYDVQIYHP